MINQKDENGSKHGPWEDYHDNGQLYYKGRYKNGKFHSLWTVYDYNGQTRQKGEYKSGRFRGKKRGLWYSQLL